MELSLLPRAWTQVLGVTDNVNGLAKPISSFYLLERPVLFSPATLRPSTQGINPSSILGMNHDRPKPITVIVFPCQYWLIKNHVM